MTLPIKAPLKAVRACEYDTPKLVDTLARAFVDDPIYNWLIDGDKKRLYPLFQTYLQRLALKHNETFMTPDRLGASLWAPPAGWRMGLAEEFGFLPEWLKVVSFRQLWSRWRAVERIQRDHPTTPHWYLMAIGNAPEVRGKGRAGALFSPVLSRCDKTQTPAYLETATPANLSLFRHYGFRVVDELKIAGGPKLWMMWREPMAKSA